MKFTSVPAYHLPWCAIVLTISCVVGGCRSAHVARTPDSGFYDPTSEQADEALAGALANFAAGVLREGLHENGAAAYYERAAELAPGSVRVYFHLARHHLAAGRHESALAAARQAARKNPDSEEAALLLAHVAQTLQRNDLALEALLRAVEIAPGNVANYLQQAALLMARGDDQAAVDVLHAALPVVDEPLPVWRVLGDVHLARMGDIRDGAPDPDMLKAALECYEQAASFPPDELWGDYLHKLADLYLFSGRQDRGIDALLRILRHNPDDLPARHKLVRHVPDAGLSREQYELLEDAARRAADAAGVYLLLAELHEAAGAPELARAAYESARAAGPDHPAAVTKLAMLTAHEDPLQAVRLVEKALQRRPDDVTLLDLLARLHLVRNEGALALPIFERLEQIIRDDRQAGKLTAAFFAGYAEAARINDMPRKAVELYRRALLEDPGLLEAYFHLAALHLDLGDGDQALEVMRAAQDVRPRDPAVHYMAGLLANRAGDFEYACRSFELVREVRAASESNDLPRLEADFYFNFGAACERIGRYEQAEELLLEATRRDPGHAEAFNYLAYMWAEQGRNLERALLFVEHALDHDPENGAFLDTLGWIYYKQGDYEKARRHLEEALWRLPDDPVVLEHYGDVMHKLDRENEALCWWKKSLRAGGDSPDLLDNLRNAGIDVESLIAEQSAPLQQEDEEANE